MIQKFKQIFCPKLHVSYVFLEWVLCLSGMCGGRMVSPLDSGSGGLGSSPGGSTALCSWARHFTLMVPLSTHVHKWVPVNFMLGVGLAIHPGGNTNTSSNFMLQNSG